MMVLNDSQQQFLKAFQEQLSEVTTEAYVIQKLSLLMRQQDNPVLQNTILQLWLEEVQRSNHPTRLLSLCYLANDVIQYLRMSKENVVYRYNFTIPLAQAFVIIRQKAPSIIPKISRLIGIFQDRMIYDTKTLKLLNRALNEDFNSVTIRVIPSLISDMKNYQEERIALLEREVLEKQQKTDSAVQNVNTKTCAQEHHVPVATTYCNNTPSDFATPSHGTFFSDCCLKQSSVSAPVNSDISQPCIGHYLPQVINRPDDILKEDDLKSLIQCFEEMCVPKISTSNKKLTEHLFSLQQSLSQHHSANNKMDVEPSFKDFELLQKLSVQCHEAIDEKVERRHKEQERARFSLISMEPVSKSGASRVELLLKKEWTLRNRKSQIDHCLYWKLVDFTKYLSSRLTTFRAIFNTVTKEIQRRNKTQIMTNIVTNS
ncbi:uncharacterized protein LOC128883003 isoform X1 [Hylaeus volcanicus]|uniref:uncharacterized protein LOC128883003 isoform X1 n=1 Tax=Hylaeus volcanicus TaxID=313075 RepID=UPI0023B81286|nr:uncharacterized protein LOC128883003 isoform X1 [Hylaeus volcanicus]XP_053990912.1 uncharacterized protein LOC128883003 isoform X1 [Hylaeus volcanicus]